MLKHSYNKQNYIGKLQSFFQSFKIILLLLILRIISRVIFYSDKTPESPYICPIIKKYLHNLVCTRSVYRLEYIQKKSQNVFITILFPYT